MLARYLPGFGNPLDMTLEEVEGLGEALDGILRAENGTREDVTDHRAMVDAEMRRLHG